MMNGSFIRPFCLPWRAWQEAIKRRFGFLPARHGLCAVIMAMVFALSPAAHAEDLFAQFNTLKLLAKTLQAETLQASGRASTHPFAPPDAFTKAEEFSRNISTFSNLAANLSARLEAQGGPKDLRCIYRGMAEDAKTRLFALRQAKNAGAQATILKDLSALFADAVDVTPKTPEALSDRNDGDGGQCAAKPVQKIETLPKL